MVQGRIVLTMRKLYGSHLAHYLSIYVSTDFNLPQVKNPKSFLLLFFFSCQILADFIKIGQIADFLLK